MEMMKLKIVGVEIVNKFDKAKENSNEEIKE